MSLKCENAVCLETKSCIQQMLLPKDDATNIFTNFHHDTVLLDLIHLYELEKGVLGRRGYANVLGVLLVRLITN